MGVVDTFGLYNQEQFIMVRVVISVPNKSKAQQLYFCTFLKKCHKVTLEKKKKIPRKNVEGIHYPWVIATFLVEKVLSEESLSQSVNKT